MEQSCFLEVSEKSLNLTMKLCTLDHDIILSNINPLPHFAACQKPPFTIYSKLPVIIKNNHFPLLVMFKMGLHIFILMYLNDRRWNSYFSSHILFSRNYLLFLVSKILVVIPAPDQKSEGTNLLLLILYISISNFRSFRRSDLQLWPF